MYYQERWINGKLYLRHTPKEQWREVSKERYEQHLEELKNNVEMRNSQIKFIKSRLKELTLNTYSYVLQGGAYGAFDNGTVKAHSMVEAIGKAKEETNNITNTMNLVLDLHSLPTIKIDWGYLEVTQIS